MDFKDSCNFVHVEAELSPGAIKQWLSIIKDGKKLEKGNRRANLTTKVKKHLAALGWVFSYAHKGNKRELRYKSPKGRWFYSLATACMSCCVHEEEDLQIVPKDDLSCSPRNRSLELSNFVEIVPPVKTDLDFDVSNKKRKRVEETPKEETNGSSDLITIVPDFDVSNQKSKKTKRVADCDTAAFNGEETLQNEEDSVKIVSSDDVSNQNQKKERNRPEDCDINGETREENHSVKLVSSFDESKKKTDCDDTVPFNGETPKNEEDSVKIVSSFDVSNRNRAEDCDINGATPNEENHLCDIVPNFDESKKRKRENDNVESPKEEEKNCSSGGYITIVLNIDVSDHQEKKKKRRKRVTFNESTTPVRPRIGKTLRKILQVMDKKKREKESLRFWRKDCGAEMNCDVCCVCHFGGELLLCDGCPSAFHHTCLGLSSLPEEDLWFCSCCCCDICKSIESPGNSKLMSCEQCQRRFHLKCLEEKGSSSCAVSWRGWFCSSQCDRVFSALQSLLGCKFSVGDDLVWTMMRAPDELEQYQEISKLNSAVEILHQGFEDSKDPFSGKDLVEEMIFRRDRGFYTVIVERNKKPVTVAAIRVGKDEAEIPLVATLWTHRRSGLCRVLMDELEKQMCGMGVFRLVLPAATDVVTTWTQRFGFSVMESSERLEAVKHGMLDFVGTVMCHKFLLMETQEEDSADSSLTE